MLQQWYDEEWWCNVVQELTMMYGHVTMMFVNSYECATSFDSVVTMCYYVTILYIDVHYGATWCDDVY